MAYPLRDAWYGERIIRPLTRLMKLLTRRGVLVEEMGKINLAEPGVDGDETRPLRPLQAAVVTHRVAFGPRAGRKVLTLRAATPRDVAPRHPLCADIDGLSLHACRGALLSTRLQAAGATMPRHRRPALSDERVQCKAAGQLELTLKTPWSDGITHLVVPPLEFVQRRAAPVPATLSRSREARANDGFAASNSEHRMSTKGRVMTDAPPSSPPQSDP